MTRKYYEIEVSREVYDWLKSLAKPRERMSSVFRRAMNWYEIELQREQVIGIKQQPEKPTDNIKEI
jgi:hypothetical protein